MPHGAGHSIWTPAPEIVLNLGHDGAVNAGRDLWAAVDRIVGSTTDVDALRANRLHLLAARRWRELGVEVPAELEAAERRSVLVSFVLPEVLGRVRAAVDGPLVVHKGPELALRYPDPLLRPYIDLDVLVPDAAAVQRALVAGGFQELGDPVLYSEAAHELPLEWPGLPLLVEVHSDLNWPTWLARSPTEELLAAAVPSRLGVAGVDTLAPHHHVLAVAAHAWAHGPFARVGDLVDVAALQEGIDDAELMLTARRFGLEGLWRTTTRTADAVLFGGERPLAVRTWARNLLAVRERTVLETHVGRWLAGFSALGPRGGVRVLGQEIAKDVRPGVGETWDDKLARIPHAFRDAFLPSSRHDRRLEETRRRH
jgi:hypothetical protein